MNEYWVIKSFFRLSERYFFRSPNEEDIYKKFPIWEDGIWGATRVDSEQEAIDQLKEGREKYHWGGLFQIEKIYVSN